MFSRGRLRGHGGTGQDLLSRPAEGLVRCRARRRNDSPVQRCRHPALFKPSAAQPRTARVVPFSTASLCPPPGWHDTARALPMVPVGTEMRSALCGQPHHPLADLPQLPGNSVVPGAGPRLLWAAVGKVAPAERLDALLGGAVDGGLGSAHGVSEEEPREGHEKRPQPGRDEGEQRRVHDACGQRWSMPRCPSGWAELGEALRPCASSVSMGHREALSQHRTPAPQRPQFAAQHEAAEPRDSAPCLGQTRGSASPEVRRRRLTWVQRVAGDAGALEPAGQLPGEEDVGQLAVAVGLEVLQHALHRPAQALKVDAPRAVGAGGHDHDAAGRAVLQALQQQLRQQEVAQVVHLEHQVAAVRPPAPGRDACKGRRLQRRQALQAFGARREPRASPALRTRRSRRGSQRRKVSAKARTESRLARSRLMNRTSLFPVSCGERGRRGAGMRALAGHPRPAQGELLEPEG